MANETLVDYGHSDLPNYVPPTVLAVKCTDDVIRIPLADPATGALPVAIVSGGGGGGGGGGDASAANQTSQIALETSMDASLTTIKNKDFSTAAKQDTGNASLASLDGRVTSLDAKIPALLMGRLPAILPDLPLTEKGMLSVGNGVQKFRENWTQYAVGDAPNPAGWATTWTNQGTGFVRRRGDSQGATYMCLSLCPLQQNSEVTLESVANFRFPIRHAAAYSMSQRVAGIEAEVGFIGVNNTTLVSEYISPKADVAIATAAGATSLTTFTTSTPHGLVGGDRVNIVGVVDPRFNFQHELVTILTPTTFTTVSTPGNGVNSTGGTVKSNDPFDSAKNATSWFHNGTSATSSSSNWIMQRRNGSAFRVVGFATNTTAATANAVPFSDSIAPSLKNEQLISEEEISFITSVPDATSAPTSAKFTTLISEDDRRNKLRFRIKSAHGLTVPVARITAIAKTGTTTATVTTDVAHGLAATDYVQIYGVADITNFPALTAQTLVSSIVSPTQFTVVIGTASTSSSAGGAVWKVNGAVLAPGVIPQSIQSISRTGNVLTAIGNTTWATPVVGETMHIYGCNATSMGLYDGAYRVLRVSTTTLDLESVGADFGSIACGGSVIRRSELRIHETSAIEYARLIAEFAGANGNPDAQKSVPMNVTAGTLTTCSTVSSVTSNNTGIPLLVADVASAALTTTTTTTAITPTSGSAYTVEIAVTAVAGTTPTLDVGIEESDDSGTNWYRVYDFLRITATGAYRSPVLKLRGNRVRYVQTVAGSGASFTRVVNRLQSSAPTPMLVQSIDRTAALLNTTGNATAALLSEGCTSFNFICRCTAQTGAATVDLQGSEDGTNWYTITGATLTSINGTVRSAVTNVQAKFVRGFVTTQGSSITLAELTIKGVE